MKSVVMLLVAALALAGCAKPPEQVYTHPKTGIEKLAVHVKECADMADKFGYINMSPVHQYPMPNMKDHFQREKVFRFCMMKKGYELKNSNVATIDSSTTTIMLSKSSLSAGEEALVTISFKSAVGGLETSDIEFSNGTLSKFKTTDRGLTWTATLTPNAGIEAAHNVLRLDNSGVINGVTNPGVGFTLSKNFTIDTLRPTVKIKVTPISPDAPAEASVPGLPAAPASASVPGTPDAPAEARIPGTPVAPASASVPGSPAVPTEASIPAEHDMPLGAEAPTNVDGPDMVGVPVSFSDKDIYVVNTHQRALVDFDFSEPPVNFGKDDITVTNGNLGKLVRDDATRYHSVFTANENFKGSGIIAIKAARFTDMARNGNKPARPGIVAIDTLRPAITASVDSGGVVYH